MAKDPKIGRNTQTWFDIETTGVSRPVMGSHFLRSSVLEIGYTTPGGVANLEAAPASARMSIWSHQKVWEPMQAGRRARGMTNAMKTERQILERFLTHLNTLPDGSELLGWNIGYTPKVAGGRDPLFGYDIPGIMTRADAYGMGDKFENAFNRLNIRDVGQEFAVRVTQGMHEELGEKGVNRLVRLGILDKAAVQTNKLQFIDEYLDLLVTRGIDLAEVYEQARRSGSPYLKGTAAQSIEEAVNSVRNMPTFTAEAKGQLKSGGVEEKLRRQAFGYYRQILANRRTAGDNVQEVARSLATGGKKFAGWSQEVVQNTMMEFYGITKADGTMNLDNALVKTYAEQQNVSKAKAWEILTSSQTHRAGEDIAIARALTGHVDKMGAILSDTERAKRFFSIWGKHAQYKKTLTSVMYKDFSGQSIQALRAPVDGSKPFGGFTEAQVFEDLAGAAEAKYGKGPWEERLRGLQPHENLETKFNLITEKAVGEFPGLGTPGSKIKGKSDPDHYIGLLKDVPEELKVGGKAALAIGTIATIAPLSVFHEPGTEFTDSVDPYWQHSLLGIPKISGSDDHFNTIEGMRHGRMAGDLRGRFTDFGSGWLPSSGNSMSLADSEFSLDPNIETRRRLKALRSDGEVTSGELLSWQRAQNYSLDTSLNQYLMRISEGSQYGVGGMVRMAAFNFSDGVPVPDTMYGVNLDPRIIEFRKNILQDKDAYADFQERYKAAQREGREQLGKFARGDLYDEDASNFQGMSLHASNLRAVNLQDFHMEVEDADTLVLKKKGLRHVFDKPVYVRLAGIDAPEVGGHGHDPMAEWRINQEQPYGRQATAQLQRIIDQQEELSLLIDPSQVTYGRYLGVLAGDEGQNINLELLRTGAVSALPWGKTSEGDMLDRMFAEQAEAEAFQNEEGMWRYSRYKAIKEMGDALGTDITHNTYTDITKLAKNLDLAGYAGYLESKGPIQADLGPSEIKGIRGVAQNLQKSGFTGSRRAVWQKNYNRGAPGYSIPQKPKQFDYKLTQPLQLNSRDDHYVNIEGLRHGGSAAAGRRQTDFGSGWNPLKNIAKPYFFPRVQETSTRFAKPKPPSSGSTTSSHINRAVMRDYVEYKSATTNAVHRTDIALESLIQGKNVSSSKLNRDIHNFMEYSPNRAVTSKLDIPNFSSKNSIKQSTHLDDQDRALRASQSSRAATRKIKHLKRHKDTVRLASINSKDAGKRSKKGFGVDNFVVTI